MNKAPEEAKEVYVGWFSVAPSGAWMVLRAKPTVSPWATICRASGAWVAFEFLEE